MTAQNAQVIVRRSGKNFFKSPVKLRHLVWSTYLISSWNWVFEWSPSGKVFSLPHGHLVWTENDHPNTGNATFNFQADRGERRKNTTHSSIASTIVRVCMYDNLRGRAYSRPKYRFSPIPFEYYDFGSWQVLWYIFPLLSPKDVSQCMVFWRLNSVVYIRILIN